jgi:threonine-phosphate decarboxylase
LDFCEGESAIKFLDSYEKLYILKSMTKFYSSAGIRVGAVISSKENIEKLKNTQPSWQLSQFDISYLKSALRDKKLRKKTLKKTKRYKEKLVEILVNSSYIEKVYDSDVNFVMIKLKGIDAIEFQKLLAKKRILIRDCSNFDFLDNTHVRVAVKNKKSIESLRELILGYL